MRAILLGSIVVAVVVSGAKGRPPQSTLVTSVPATGNAISTADESDDVGDVASPIITEFTVRSDIQFRYARTVVESYVKNPSSRSNNVTFAVVIPDDAFVSNFSMLIADKEYVAQVKEKEAAEAAYDQAVGSGQSAGIARQDVRDANVISVDTNVEARGKVRFRLVYEELLRRRLGRYEHVVHVKPGQVVPDFKVDVFINESLPVTDVRVPRFKTDPNAIPTSEDENPAAVVEFDDEDPSRVEVAFRPSTEYQKQIGDAGLSGQFVVQYDVDRKNESSDIQVLDGYFVHFFAPEGLPTLPKHVVFVLDVSGSMYGEKLLQTKDAMVAILDDMTDQDSFNILTFSDNVHNWVPENEKLHEGPHNITYPGTEEIKSEALRYVLELQTLGGTNINDALLRALSLVQDVQRSEMLTANTKPTIIFLTDGQATTGVTDNSNIKSNVRSMNKDMNVPIYGLAFGEGADFKLIKAISLESGVFARRIYEGSDATIQLEDFYLEIANPLLDDVDFDYVGELENATMTRSNLGTFNKGNEFVIAGKLGPPESNNGSLQKVDVTITGKGAEGHFRKLIHICLPPFPPFIPKPVPFEQELTVNSTDERHENESSYVDIIDDCWYPIPRPTREPRSDAQNFVERMWAFLTIKDLLNDKDYDVAKTEEKSMQFEELKTPQGGRTDEEKLKSRSEKAVDIALKYNFVTPLTSLVVARPEEAGKNLSEPVIIEPVPVSEASSSRYSPFARTGGCPTCLSLHRSGGGLNFALAAAPIPPSGPFKATLGAPPSLKSHSPVTYDYSFHDSSVVLESETLETETLPTSTTPSSPCVIALFSKTLLRGESVSLTDDVLDLSTLGFEKKLTSLKVEGTCCWQVFSKPGHADESVVFREGEYKSASQMGKLFRNASSVKRLDQC